MQLFVQKHPVLLFYIFFSYFSIVTQSLIYFFQMSGSTSLRDAILMSVIWLIPCLLLPKNSKFIAAILGLILWLSSLISLGYFLIYGQDFSQSAIFIIFESNTAEGGEFIRSYLRWWHICIFLIYSVIPIVIWKNIPTMSATPFSNYVYTACFIVIICWPFFSTLIKTQNFKIASNHLMARLEPATPWNIIVGYLKYREQLSAMTILLGSNSKLPPVGNLTKDKDLLPDTLVLVIGESTNRQRMSLYGYPRETSPQLTKLLEELTIFNHAISPRPYTIEALQQILSIADQKNPERFFSQPTLLNILSQAGFETTWITNHQTQTRRNTMLTVLSQTADHHVYLNNNRRQNAAQFDEVVLEPFSEALKRTGPHKLIVVHLLGTHRKYDFRYPKTYEKFTNRDGVPEWIKDSNLEEYNSYDNAILYNDYIVASLIARLKEKNDKALFIYLSDHGEEVFDYNQKPFCGRNENSPSQAMYTVPFMTWMSKTLRVAHKKSWNDYSERFFSTSDFFHTLPDMIGINFDGMDKTRSLVSKNFVRHTRWIGNPRYPKNLKDYDAANTFLD